MRRIIISGRQINTLEEDVESLDVGGAWDISIFLSSYHSAMEKYDIVYAEFKGITEIRQTIFGHTVIFTEAFKLVFMDGTIIHHYTPIELFHLTTKGIELLVKSQALYSDEGI